MSTNTPPPGGWHPQSGMPPQGPPPQQPPPAQQFAPPPAPPQQFAPVPPTGYAPTPPPPPPPPTTAPGKPVGWTIALVLSLLVVLGTGGGTAYLLTQETPDPYADIAWTTEPYEPAGGFELDSTNILSGVWFTEDGIVQTLPDGIMSYDRADGAKLWGTALPEPGTIACAGSSDSTSNVGLVGYGDKESCTRLAAYDLGTGKVLWKAPIPKKERLKESEPLARSGNVVVVQAGGLPKALRVDNGKPAWDPASHKTSSCEDSGTFAGGERMIRMRSCRDDGLYYEVAQVDPLTGKAQWTAEFPEGRVGSVLSSHPLVVELDTDEGKQAVALDDKTGEIRSELTTDSYEFFKASEIDGKTLYLSGQTEGQEGVLAAYDLDSGEQLWEKQSDGKNRQFPLWDERKNRVVVYDTGHEKLTPKLLALDKKGKQRVLVEYPDEVRRASGGEFAYPYLYDGQLFLDHGSTTNSSSDSIGAALLALRTEE